MISTAPKIYSVCLARFRFLESDQHKIRPVIVVSKPRGKLQILMTIPVSSSLASEEVDVRLEDWQDSGLVKPSVARVHRLTAILQQDVLEEIGMIDAKHKRAIIHALKTLLEL